MSPSSDYTALGFLGLQPPSRSTPISAISQTGSEVGSAMDVDNNPQLPDLDELAARKGAPLDVEDLDDLGWKAASARGMIEKIGSLGEGAGGAVSKARVKGSKTIFALKVCLSSHFDIF